LATRGRSQHRPLRWLMTIVPGERRPTTMHAFDEAFRAGTQMHRFGLRIARTVTRRVNAPDDLISQVQVMGYVLTAAAAARLLIRAGFARAAQAQLRAMVEGFAVVECLHGDPARARRWRDARTPKERLAFSFERLRSCSPTAHRMQPLWDGLNEWMHTNSTSLPVHGRRREVFGMDIPAGPMFDRRGLAFVLHLVDSVEYVFIEWCFDKLIPANRSRERIRPRLGQLGAAVSHAHFALQRLSETQLPQRDRQGISVEEQRHALRELRRMRDELVARTGNGC
jgi:hypothetical protein